MKSPKLDPDDLNLIKLAQEYSNSNDARALLEELLWPDGPVCPHCKNHKEKPIYKLNPAKGSSTRKGVYKCGACRKQFTVTVGTIVEDSHIPLGTWLMAIFILCSSKKAISAHQLHRMLDITYKSAWFLAHRIRFALGPDKNTKLGGVVEADEAFIGGKGDKTTKPAPKTPVVALIEQGGSMRTHVITTVSQHNLGKCLYESVDKSAILCTDEHPGYKKPGKEYKLHYSVNHSKAEFERREKDGTRTSTNHCESFFSLLKRGVYGSWHHVSKEHLPKYANEFAFRWNTRDMTDGKRMTKAIGLTTGKRLTYRQVA